MRTPSFLMLLAVLVLPALAGCGKTVTSTAPMAASAPLANSPEGVVHRLAWAWNHRDADMYEQLFTDDFLAAALPADYAESLGVAASTWGRDAEEKVGTTIFVGDAIHPHVSAVAVAFDSVYASGDPTMSILAIAHRWVNTSADVHLTIALNSGLSDTRFYHGHSGFYVIRGDSAQIPASLLAKGIVPDSTRWWIRRWEDRIGTGTDTTWLQLKKRFF